MFELAIKNFAFCLRGRNWYQLGFWHSKNFFYTINCFFFFRSTHVNKLAERFLFRCESIFVVCRLLFLLLLPTSLVVPSLPRSKSASGSVRKIVFGTEVSPAAQSVRSRNRTALLDLQRLLNYWFLGIDLSQACVRAAVDTWIFSANCLETRDKINCFELIRSRCKRSQLRPLAASLLEFSYSLFPPGYETR